MSSVRCSVGQDRHTNLQVRRDDRRLRPSPAGVAGAEQQWPAPELIDGDRSRRVNGERDNLPGTDTSPHTHSTCDYIGHTLSGTTRTQASQSASIPVPDISIWRGAVVEHELMLWIEGAALRRGWMKFRLSSAARVAPVTPPGGPALEAPPPIGPTPGPRNTRIGGYGEPPSPSPSFATYCFTFEN